MARRCLCDHLLSLLDTDARLRTLPLAARMLWLILARYAAGAENTRIPFSGTGRVSMLVSATETETETQMETLFREGLLVRDDDGLRVPLLDALPAPSRSGRGAEQRGGRPRRGETAEQARLRRAQGSLTLPIAGGGGQAADQLQAKPTRKPVSPYNNNISSSSINQKPSSSNAQALAREVSTMLGMRFAQAGEVQAWLDAGAAVGLSEETTAEIVRQVAKGTAQDPKRPASIWSAKYLTPDVMEQIGAATPAPAADPELTARIARFEARYRGGVFA